MVNKILKLRLARPANLATPAIAWILLARWGRSKLTRFAARQLHALGVHQRSREKKLKLADAIKILMRTRNYAETPGTRHPVCTDLRLLKLIVPDRGKLMASISRFETLTNRYVAIEERTKRFVCDLRRLVRLLDHDISYEEERTGISDLANSNYSITARQLRARRDNLVATICELETHAGAPYN